MLGCAQPSCIISALDADGEFQEDSQFLTDAGGQSDGFFRDGDRALKRYRNQAAPKLIAVGRWPRQINFKNLELLRAIQ